jgi:hypothetical protein
MRRILYLLLSTAVLVGFTPAVGAATLTEHRTEGAFLAALDPSIALISEDFDGFADGTVIDTQVPGVVFSSELAGQMGFVSVEAFATPRATTRPNILAGGFIENAIIDQSIVMDYTPSASALSFRLVAQNPQRLEVRLLFEFTDGTTEMLPISDADGNNNNREFFGATSDVPFHRVTYISRPQSGGLIEEFGGFDDLIVGFADDGPPICFDEPNTIDGVPGIDGTATDNGPGDTGIVGVELSADADNIELIMAPFVPPVPEISFRVELLVDEMEDGSGTVIVTDQAGNSCLTPVNFLLLEAGEIDGETLCDREGIILRATNENSANPEETSSCSGSFFEGEPTLPPGYEPFPADCRVLSLESGVSGESEVTFKKIGDFDPRLRLLFSRLDEATLQFIPFIDVTLQVVPILDVDPDPTRIRSKKVEWSDVKYACAIQAEICDGVDNDGDGLVDEGFEQQLVDCTTGAPDPTFCDVDGDETFVCGDPLLRGAEFTNVDCADQLDFVNPFARELCNGIDDDCDGEIDNGNPDGGASCTVDGQFGVCSESVLTCFEAELQCLQENLPSEEICDGEDNDCDGSVDEGFDSDSDGIADCFDVEECDGLDNDGDGLVDDDDPSVTDQSTWYRDNDGDGFGDPAMSQLACTQSAGYVADNTDCDDGDGNNFPFNPEVCDGADNDCDGSVDEGFDVDGDGFTSCGGDCNDADPAVNPLAAEIACDSVDNDCNAATPDVFDIDGDTFACDVDCDETDPAIFPAAPEVCDGRDNDCDGQIDEIFVFGGYLEPVNPDGSSIFLHRTDPRSRGTKAIPFRFQLTTCGGELVTTDQPTIEVSLLANGVAGTDVEELETSCGKADEGGVYRYEADVNEYQYNLCTKELNQNKTYLIRTTTGDGLQHDVVVSID